MADELTRLGQKLEGVERSAGKRFGSLETSVQQLSAAHQQARENLDNVKRRTEKLESDLGKANRRTDEQFGSADRQLREIRAQLEELATLTDKLAARSEVLERQVRQSLPATATAALDTWLARHTELAAQVYAGREAAHRLETMTDVQTLRERMDQHEYNLAARIEHRDKAVAAARELAELDPAADWEQPASDWRRHQQAFAKISAELAASETAARQAQVELDSHARKSAELAVESGELAETMLRQHIHDHLDTVLATDPVLPPWLANALGAGVSRTYLREWLSTAVGIMVYRLVYRITSPIDPLGPRPAEPGFRRTEFDRLKAESERYRV
jgi:chromosome segregation ATPase